MKTFDFDDEIIEDKIEKKESSPIVKKEMGYDFDVVSKEFDYMVKYEAINRHFSLKQLLEDFGVEVMRTNMYCPFHYDEDTGKPSAKYHVDSDLLYCFSESKTYSAYHALKLLFNANMETKFIEAWNHLTAVEKEEILRKYDKNDNNKGNIKFNEKKFVDPYWNKFQVVHSKFKVSEVNFKQHKNALYKIFGMIYEDEFKKLKVVLEEQEKQKQQVFENLDDEGEYGFL